MADEQTNEGYPAVALPAGSFDLQTLQKGISSAVKVKNREQHPERILAAIVDAADETTKRVLAGENSPVLPVGAVEVEQPITYVDGQEPVVTKGMAFTPAIEDSKVAPTEQRYAARGDKEVVTDAAAGAPDEVVQDEVTTLSSQAEQELAESTDTRSPRTK